MRYKNLQIDGLAQDCSNSIASALELLQPCTKPSRSSRYNSARKWLLECGFHGRVNQQYIITMNPFSITNTSPYLVLRQGVINEGLLIIVYY